MQHPVIRLVRLHQPTGIWLLMWPCFWSYTMAAGAQTHFTVLLLFLAGAATMRAAGCIVNDLTDRELDRVVMRTRTRPLASGEISTAQAKLILFILMLLAFGIAWPLGREVLLWSAASLPLVIAYPWMKRITWWPQLFLGITFNWGALVGWVAATGGISLPALLLYAGGIAWTMGYDTIYAHQDREDDTLIGIKSTARLFAENSKTAIVICYGAALLFWLLAGIYYQMPAFYFIILGMVAAHLAWQVQELDIYDSNRCHKLFKSNSILGGMLWLGIYLSHIF